MSTEFAEPKNEEELQTILSTPREQTARAIANTSGDIVVLGAGGKMGPTLCRMVARVLDGQSSRKVIAVSRFTSEHSKRSIRAAGIDTIKCDLTDRAAVSRLPDAGAAIFLAGKKFGTGSDPAATWMQNVVAPEICASRYAGVPTVALSTGNVYPLSPVEEPGSRETDPTGPIGEYAATCLGRERVLFHRSVVDNTPTTIVRLNYAIDLRYGVLTDLAMMILENRPINLAMSRVNIIWQGDACRAIIELLTHTTTPPRIVNVTGPEHLSVRDLANGLGERMDRTPTFTGTEAPTALLSSTSVMQELVGQPTTGVSTMLDWVAAWTLAGHPTLNKPTHFGERDGSF